MQKIALICSSKASLVVYSYLFIFKSKSFQAHKSPSLVESGEADSTSKLNRSSDQNLDEKVREYECLLFDILTTSD